jgi:hypothetical protein
MAESRTGTRRGLESSPPLVTAEGIKPLPPTGARKVDLRTLFFYGYTGITPAMCMRLTNIGCQYLVAFKDAGNTFLDGARSYQVTLPPDIPEARFWSLTPYDNETRSMLQTPALPPGRQPALPTPAAEANADGSTTSTWALRSRRGSPRATGSRPSPARDGSSSCACTAPWPPSSTSSADLDHPITRAPNHS